MLRELFRPWRRRTWLELCHVMLSLVVGTITFSVVVALLATAGGLLVTFLLALPVAWLLFVLAAGMGRVERNRVAALLGLDLAPPYAPLAPGSWWAHLKARVVDGGRWREIVYLLVLMPVAVVCYVVVVVAWSGSLALIGLPFFAGALPGGTAKFWLFEVSPGPTAIGLGAVGVIGVALLAPWVTVGAAHLQRMLAAALLGPRKEQQLAARVTSLDASRAAAVDVAEAERRRIERDLHDGAQARLVTLGMELGRARQQLDTDPEAARALVESAHTEAKAALAELRDLVRGVHPAILEDRGLDAALSAVMAGLSIPVALHVDVTPRPPAPVESTVYFIVNEALANVARHANATRASVSIVRRDDKIVVEVSDDGVGGANPDVGTGLRGLQDRVAALDGWMSVLSPAGGPTSILVEVPCGS